MNKNYKNFTQIVNLGFCLTLLVVKLCRLVMAEESGRKEGTSTNDSDEQYWRRYMQPPETEQLLHYIPWKSKGMSVIPDPESSLLLLRCIQKFFKRNTHASG